MDPTLATLSLQTERLRLDLVSDDDLDEIFHLYSNPEAVKYFGQDRMENIEQARFWLSIQAHMRDIGLGRSWVMRDAGSGVMIGTIGFDGINRQWHNAGISYVLHPDYWNFGLATEAVAALSRMAFSGGLNGPMHRIQALVFSENQASKRVLEKLGFIHEGRRLGLVFWQQRYWDLDSYCLLNQSC
jgi:ribosomal-protein-alanine N-acetyltransferase